MVVFISWCCLFAVLMMGSKFLSKSLKGVSYEKTDKPDCKWLRVTTKWLRVTTSDYEWLQATTSQATNDYNFD